MNLINEIMLRTLLIGVGATAVMDMVAGTAKVAFGIPTSNWAMIGRWVGHFRHGTFHHQNIAKAPAVPGELGLGWTVHYVTGVIYAALLIAIGGLEWARDPTPALPIVFGISTLAAPFFVMQPGMGYGIAASHTPNPLHARMRSLMNHTAFGCGLYLTAVLFAALLPF